jgi:small-conductance mechanosensitive channel
VYGTEVEKLKRIPEIVREVIEPLKEAEFARAHFHEMGDFSLIYEIVYHVIEPGYDVYMDLQQAINLGLYERFSQEGIEFAFPTQTLVIDQE